MSLPDSIARVTNGTKLTNMRWQGTRRWPTTREIVLQIGGAVVALAVGGCGGGGGGGGAAFPLVPSPAPAPPASDAPPPAPAPPAPAPPPVAPPAVPTTLSISVAALALSVNAPSTNPALSGTPRTITVTNTGASDAVDVAFSLGKSLPSGTTVSPASCGLIHAGSTCVLTVTPGAVPSAAPGDLGPTPVVISVAGTNTNTVATAIQIIGYGSVYQSGYLFSVDDTTPSTGSIGGKVASLSRTPLLGYGTDTIAIGAGAQSATDGASNTAAIVAGLGSGLAYAARSCAERNDGGYSDWYLPAICEIDAGDLNLCQALMQQNIQKNLVDIGLLDTLTYFWSSTEDAANPQSQAYEHYSSSASPNGFSVSALKYFPSASYCARPIQY